MVQQHRPNRMHHLGQPVRSELLATHCLRITLPSRHRSHTAQLGRTSPPLRLWLDVHSPAINRCGRRLGRMSAALGTHSRGCNPRVARCCSLRSDLRSSSQPQRCSSSRADRERSHGVEATVVGPDVAAAGRHCCMSRPAVTGWTRRAHRPTIPAESEHHDWHGCDRRIIGRVGGVSSAVPGHPRRGG
jgi:hypothetical protein